MTVRYSPLQQQFANVDSVFDELKNLVASGDFTLGKVVAEFEQMFADVVGTKYAIGVGSGTDSLKLALCAAGIGRGDEVITNANTFYATIGAICELGAVPVFVDCDDFFCMDVEKLETAITPKTRAIMPAHISGEVTDMQKISDIAERHNLVLVEDACQSLLGEIDGRKAGTWGIASGFSVHPLKIINVWGDGGIVVTDDAEIDRKVRLLRNHGLRNRDEMEILGYNSRLDSVQAVVGKWIVKQTESIVSQRIKHAAHYDAAFADIPEIRVPPRRANGRNVYLLYMVFAESRDELLAHCIAEGIEAKIHYPLPIYRQDALRFLNHEYGDFPTTDRHAETLISFPVDQHLEIAELDRVVEAVRVFYKG
ncbi:DegT/DnrJ/EryC1/StrS family aminotransferase [Rhodospirillales bacterium]|nr:DegT/DnrJ/EryC1/StrS family aminotransferase [Rhodospirillales bacterium]